MLGKTGKPQLQLLKLNADGRWDSLRELLRDDFRKQPAKFLLDQKAPNLHANSLARLSATCHRQSSGPSHHEQPADENVSGDS